MILVYVPLLEWYVNHGLGITAVDRTIDYERDRPFTWFVNYVTKNRHKGEEDPEKILLTVVFKLLGNSAYLKLIEAVERQKNWKGRYSWPEKACWKAFWQMILVYVPLLEWYVNHGLGITAVDRTIDYERDRPFTWFVNYVTKNRHKGEEDPEKILLTVVFKLLGNSAYLKLIEAVERQTKVIYTTDQNTVNKAKQSLLFDNIEEIKDVFEILCRKEKVKTDRPF